MFRTEMCVTVACDLCGAGVEGDMGEEHYASVEEAKRAAVEGGWRELAGGQLVCPDHGAHLSEAVS